MTASPKPLGAAAADVAANRRGTSLLECALALVLAGLLTTELARSLQTSASILASARSRDRAIDVARNLLESELGSPCGPPYACPDGFRCELQRSRDVRPTLDRLRAVASVEPPSPSLAAVTFSVLVRAAACS